MPQIFLLCLRTLFFRIPHVLALCSLLMMTLFWSCSSNLDPSPVIDNGSDRQIQNRSEPCEPQGTDCEDPIVEVLQINAGNDLPCSVEIEMIVTVCESEINFQEVSITPAIDPDCVLTQEDLDNAYNRFIELYMDLIANVAPCASSSTTHSNYIKKSCVQACYGFATEGEPSPIIYRPCSSGATGCCIVKTRWCYEEGNAIQIGEDTEIIPGNCTGDLSAGCIVEGFKNICIASRCEE